MKNPPTSATAGAHNPMPNPAAGAVDPMPMPNGAHTAGATTTANTGQPMPMPNGAHAGGAAAMTPGSAPGGGAAPQFAAGSAEEVLLKFCTAMADSNLTDAGQYISPRAKGMLTQIRDGSMTDEKLDDLKASFSLQGLQLKPNRSTGVGRTITLGNSKSETLSFTLVKEDDAYKLREFKVSKSSR